MTTLTFKEIMLNSASFGEKNPMPDLKNNSYIHSKISRGDHLTEEDSRCVGMGMISTLLPYLSEDDYDRDLKMRPFKAAILENDMMRAVFLPELGGRLWSLYHKVLCRELLYKNEIVQPANLALLNAWCAGGVEWNVGIKGHTPFTCSQLFTAEGKTASGDPVLTMYEYERIRGTVFGINVRLIDDKLYVRTTIENVSGGDTFTYWWSNIAVPERSVRVLAEADEMIGCIYAKDGYTIDRMPAPIFAEADISYPERASHAGDVFFVLKRPSRPWIAAIGEDGIGLLQYSTTALRGRKVFFWGKGKGGRNWNRHLTGSDEGYIEIQAGLMRTQLEHRPMAAGETIEFTECYTAAALDKELLSADWKAASAALGNEVAKLPDPKSIDIPLKASRDIKHLGSGWGALEKGKSSYYEFPESSVGNAEAPWKILLEEGRLPASSPKLPPESYYVSREARDKLLEYSKTEIGRNWHTCYHLGIMNYALGDIDAAKEQFELSHELCPNPWSLRNLAMLSKAEGDMRDAVQKMKQALDLGGDLCRGLVLNAADVFTEGGAPEELISRYFGFIDEIRGCARLKFYLALAYLRTGDLSSAKEIINEKFEMADIKEGELSISALWRELYDEVTPIPDRLNFVMKE